MKTATKINQDSDGKPLSPAELTSTPKVVYTDYIVLCRLTPGELGEEVKEYMEKGWVPLGTAQCHYRVWSESEIWHQTMIKPAPGV